VDADAFDEPTHERIPTDLERMLRGEEDALGTHGNLRASAERSP
jgi:hypothetical protein